MTLVFQTIYIKINRAFITKSVIKSKTVLVREKKKSSCLFQKLISSVGRGCSSVGRASDQLAAHAGLIPQCGKGYFSQSPFRAVSHDVHTPQQAIACIYFYAYVKDPIVYVRIWWIMETLKHKACTIGWVA